MQAPFPIINQASERMMLKIRQSTNDQNSLRFKLNYFAIKMRGHMQEPNERENSVSTVLYIYVKLRLLKEKNT